MPKSHWLQNEIGGQVTWERGSGGALEVVAAEGCHAPRCSGWAESHRVLPALPEPPRRASWHRQMEKSPERLF